MPITTNSHIRFLLVWAVFLGICVPRVGAASRIESMERGWSGNGGDLPKDQHNAWFLKTSSEEFVDYCVRVDSKFTFSKFRAALLIEAAISDWKKFFQRHNLDQAVLGSNPKLRFPDGRERTINLNFREVACDDTKPELVTFAFGLKSQEIQDYLSANGPSLAVALRRTYEHLTFRTGGIVWFSDFTKSENKLKHMIQHEIGHILGMCHNSTFVMDEKVADFLSTYSEVLNQSEIAVIESRRWPYRMIGGEVVDLYVGNPLTTKLGYKSNYFIPTSLRKLLGLPDEGYHKLRFGWVPSRGANAYRLWIEELGTLSTQKFLDGTLTPQDQILENDLGPGVFTKFVDTQATASLGVFVRASLDRSPMILPAKGFLEIQGVRVPATLDFQRGLELSLFDSGTGHWWRIER